VARRNSKARRRAVFFVYLLGLVIVVLLLPARLTAPSRILLAEFAAPGEQILFRAAGNGLAVTGTLRDAFLGQERERLAESQVRRLLNDYEKLRESVRGQEQRLKSFEALEVAEFRFRALSADVTAYDTSAMRQSIVVAAGRTHGVREGMAVVAEGAVVGKVAEAGVWHSRVRLITDPGSLLSCRLGRTRSLCILRGTGGADCEVEWVDRSSSVQLGDVLVSAPAETALTGQRLVPQGLPVAAVIGVERGRADPLFLWVKAAPRVNVRRLEFVEVIVPVSMAGVGMLPAEVE